MSDPQPRRRAKPVRQLLSWLKWCIVFAIVTPVIYLPAYFLLTLSHRHSAEEALLIRVTTYKHLIKDEVISRISPLPREERPPPAKSYHSFCGATDFASTCILFDSGATGDNLKYYACFPLLYLECRWREGEFGRIPCYRAAVAELREAGKIE